MPATNNGNGHASNPAPVEILDLATLNTTNTEELAVGKKQNI